jgi:glycyl-tRNA synthetase
MNGAAAELKQIGEAVDDGTIANEILAYFMARIQMYMVKISVDPTKLRFRQHIDNETDHYACSSWDIECLNILYRFKLFFSFFTGLDQMR